MIRRQTCFILAALMLAGCGSTAAANTSAAATLAPETSAPAASESSSASETSTDLVTSATDQGKGLNFGLYEESDALKQATVLEYLKGDNGNYREMYQIATCYNDVPTASTVEFVLDPENFNFYGLSEKGTEKTLELAVNPNISMYWTRQLRDAELEAGMTYFASYGVQITGTAHIFTKEELDNDPMELLHIFDTYYPTLPSTAAVWSKMENDDAKIQYISRILDAQVVYKVVPSKIVITQPYMLNMGGEHASCAVYTTKGNYTYPFISGDFFDKVIDEKLDSDAFKQAVDQAYPETEITDDMSDEDKQKAETNNTTRQILLGENTCGVMTQQILTNFTPVK